MNEVDQEIREYLLDLIIFLKETPSKEKGKSAYDVLIERRSDIGKLNVNSDSIFVPIYPIEVVLELVDIKEQSDLEWLDWWIEKEKTTKEDYSGKDQ